MTDDVDLTNLIELAIRTWLEHRLKGTVHPDELIRPLVANIESVVTAVECPGCRLALTAKLANTFVTALNLPPIDADKFNHESHDDEALRRMVPRGTA